MRDQIGAALDAADISYTDQAREVSWLPALEQSAPYEIWILREDHDSAIQVLSEAFPEGAEASDDVRVEDLADLGDETPGGTPSNDLPPEIHPEDASCEIWSGDDEHTAQFLSDCLRGIGIACVVFADDGKARVLVLPETETRAREIVHEVVDGAPPE